MLSCKDKIMEKRMIPLYAAPGMGKKLFACFGCSTVRDKDDLEHFKKHPACLEAHREGVTKFLAREVKSVDVKSAENEMRLRRQTEKQKQMLEQLSEEFAAYKEAVSKLLNRKRDDGDDLELEDIQKLVEEVEVVEAEEVEIVPQPETSLHVKLTIPEPEEKVLELSTPTTFRNETENFTCSEVSILKESPTSPPSEVSPPVKKAKKMAKKVGFVPPIEEAPQAPVPRVAESNNHFMGLGSEELGAINFEELSEEEGKLFMEAWDYAQAEGL